MPTEGVQLRPRSLPEFNFWSMVVAGFFYIIGFSSVGWENTAVHEWIGLWSTCSSQSHWYNGQGWFKATQFMMSIGLILLIASLACILMNRFPNVGNKSLQLKVSIALDFAAVVFMVIGFIIFGSKHQFNLNWSFAFCVIGSCACVIAGILSFIQLLRQHAAQVQVELRPNSLSGFSFWSMVVASFFYIIGFSSVGWENTAVHEWIGLWSTCSSQSHWYNGQGWFKATQSMMSIGLILLIGSLACILMFMFLNFANKSFQLKVFIALDFAAVVFMVIGFSIFGSKHLFNLNWSFAFCVIGSCICVIAGILSFIQLRQ